MSDFFANHGGALLPGAPAYIHRPQVEQVLHCVKQGTFCHILTPRQMGKTTLKNIVVDRLRHDHASDEVYPVVVDLDRIGAAGFSQADATEALAGFCYGLLETITTTLKLQLKLPVWWERHRNLGCAEQLFSFFGDTVLQEIPSGIIAIFIDEIGTIRALGSASEPFFAALQAIEAAKNSDPAYQRLSFILLGTATVDELTTASNTVPLDLGQQIELRDFDLSELKSWETYLETTHPGFGAQILAAVYDWTAGHPALTQKLGARIDEEGDGVWLRERIDDWVETIILPEMVKDIKSEQTLGHVQRGIEALPDKEREALLRAYRAVYQNYGREGQKDDQDSSEMAQLRMLGLIKEENGRLHVRNRLYYRIFDEAWIKARSPATRVFPRSAPRVSVAALGLTLAVLLLIVGLFLIIVRPQLASDDPTGFDGLATSLRDGDGAVGLDPGSSGGLSSDMQGNESLPTPAATKGLEDSTQIKSATSAILDAPLRALTDTLAEAAGQSTSLASAQTVADSFQIGTCEGTQSSPASNVELKLLGPCAALPDTIVPYTVTVTNVGTQTLENYTLTSNISPDIHAPIRYTGKVTVTVELDSIEKKIERIIWSPPPLEPGQSSDPLTWRGLVNPSFSFSPEKPITNSVFLIANQGPPISSTAVITSIVIHPAITLIAEAPPFALLEDTIKFTVTVTNDSAFTFSNYQVRNEIPQGILFVSAIPESGKISLDEQKKEGEAIVWPVDRLEPGSYQFIWTGRINPDYNVKKPLVNKALLMAKAQTHKEFVGLASVKTQIAVQTPPVLVLKAPDFTSPGSPFTVTITITDTGIFTDFQVKSEIPGLIHSPTNITPPGRIIEQPGEDPEEIVWSISSLGEGDLPVTLIWRGTVKHDIDSADQLLTTATLLKNDQTLITDEKTTQLVSGDISLIAWAPYDASPGEIIPFTISVINGTNAPLQTYTVTSKIPAEFIARPSIWVSGGGDLDQNELMVTWVLKDLDPKESRTLTWGGKISASLPVSANPVLKNEVRLTGTGGELKNQSYTYLVPPRISLTMDGPSLAGPGQSVVFTIKVQNTGEKPITNIKVQNAFPPSKIGEIRDIRREEGIVSGQLEGTVDDNQEITWIINRLDPGELINLTWRGTFAKKNFTDAKNTASLIYINGGPDFTVAPKTNFTTYYRAPILVLSKQAPVELRPGQSIVYTLVLKNTSDVPAINVDVTDTVDDNVINIGNISGGGGTGFTSGGGGGERTVFWTIGELGPGDSRVLSWQGQINPSIILNLADANCPGATSKCAKVGASKTATAKIVLDRTDDIKSNTPEAVTTIYAQPVRLIKSASFTAYPGGPIHFSLKIENTGQTLYDIEVTEAVPSCLRPPTFISHNGDFQGNAQIVWYIASLGPHAAIELTWDATVCLKPPDSTITSKATVTIRSLNLGQTSPEAVTQIQPLLLLSNSPSPQRAGPGQTVTYTLTVQRQDGGNLSGTLVLRTRIPDYIINPDPTMGGQLQGNEIVWQKPVQGISTEAVRWTGEIDPTAPAGFDIVNTASAEDEWGQRVEAQATVTVLPASADFSIRANPLSAPAGDSVSFTASVTNTSQFDLDNLEIRILVPDEIVDPISINNGGERIGNEIVWESADLGTLGPGESKVVTWDGTIDPSTSSSSQFRVEATLTDDGLYEGAVVTITVN